MYSNVSLKSRYKPTNNFNGINELYRYQLQLVIIYINYNNIGNVNVVKGRFKD